METADVCAQKLMAVHERVLKGFLMQRRYNNSIYTTRSSLEAPMPGNSIGAWLQQRLDYLNTKTVKSIEAPIAENSTKLVYGMSLSTSENCHSGFHASVAYP